MLLLILILLFSCFKLCCSLALLLAQEAMSILILMALKYLETRYPICERPLKLQAEHAML
jgi:hypothetical protein